MSLCINPLCDRANHQIDQGQNLFCSGCGSSLLINDIYRVLRYLGRGGFAWTALVDDASSFKVLKVLHNTDPKAISLFDQEADVLQKLNHSGIPKIEVGARFNYYPKGSHTPLYCLVMEYIEGENLETYLEKRDYRPISEQAAIRWLRELVEILDLVHSANYFHRDIKPTNIMIRNTGNLALIDFGTAREETQTYLQKQQGQGVTGIISVGYTPHEQTQGRAEIRSDFFALGRTFVFLLTGKHPHAFIESFKRGLQWQQEAQGYSQPLRDFIDWLMCPDVEDRPCNTQVILKKLATLEKNYQPASILLSTTSQTPTSSPPTLKTVVVSPSIQPSNIQKTISPQIWLIASGLIGLGAIGFGWLLSNTIFSPSVPIASEPSVQPSAKDLKPSPTPIFENTPSSINSPDSEPNILIKPSPTPIFENTPSSINSPDSEPLKSADDNLSPSPAPIFQRSPTPIPIKSPDSKPLEPATNDLKPSPTPLFKNSPTPTILTAPKQAVLKYYDAINNGQYKQAWNMLPASLQNDRRIHPDGYVSFKNWFQQITPITLTNIDEVPQLLKSNKATVNVRYRSLVKGKPLVMTLRYKLVWDESTQQWMIGSVRQMD